MQIIAPGFVPKRATASQVINPSNPTKPVRVRLTRDCVLWMGMLGREGDVVEVDAATMEGHEFLALMTGNSTSGQRVTISTPLRSAPAAPPPLAQPAPEKISAIAELARAIVQAVKEGSQPKAAKA
jgi:hypothetical protein